MRFEFNDDSQKICNSADVVNYGIQCDICGNKFQSVSNINGRRYCAGCYYKTFMKDNQKAEIDQLKQQLAEKDEEIEVISSSKKHFKTCAENISDVLKTINFLLPKPQENELNYKKVADDVVSLIEEKNREIKDLKEWQDWYSMWHKQFQKQIEDLTTELETYRPTKLHGNGQCECYKCKIECRQPIHWTDWCSKYKGHIYCDDCLKEILKEEYIPQTQLAIQELEKVKDTLKHFCNIHNDEYYGVKSQVKGIEQDVCDQINQQIKELKGEKDVKD